MGLKSAEKKLGLTGAKVKKNARGSCVMKML